MSLSERRANLVQQINNINDEQTLEMLEVSISLYTHSNGRDITDDLSPQQLRELEKMMQEPADTDTISEEEYNKMFARWRTK